jgi:hypothetical protein
MIKQELDILQENGYMDMTDKKQVIESGLLHCEQSLRESYNVIENYTYRYPTAEVLENINISLTILKLMKGESDNGL